MLKAYIINGSGGSGKDLFVEYIEHIIKENNYKISVVNYSTIEPINEAIENLGCPINDKSDKAREFRSKVKNAWDEYNEGSINETIDLINSLLDEISIHREDIYLFIHCREPQNIKKTLERSIDLCNISTLLIERIDHLAPNCDKDDPKNIKSINYDIHYTVDTKLDLFNSAMNFISNEGFKNNKTENSKGDSNDY